MTAKLQAQERPLSEWIQRFQKLLPKKDPEDIQRYKRDEMARLIGSLHKSRRPRADFFKLWNTLFWLPKMKYRLEVRRRQISEFKERTVETTKTREWARKRNRIRRDLPILLADVEELFQEAFNEASIYRIILSLNYGEERIFGKRDTNVLVLSKKLKAALLDSPLFVAEPYPRKPGHQPAPWLHKAKRNFIEAGVPQKIGNELLRLMNIKPPHTI